MGLRATSKGGGGGGDSNKEYSCQQQVRDQEQRKQNEEQTWQGVSDQIQQWEIKDILRWFYLKWLINHKFIH